VINLFLAVFWLIVAGAIFALPWLQPEAPPLTIPGTKLSVAWFALCLCAYNVARWWTMRLSAGDRSPLHRTWGRRRYLDEEADGPTPEADPRFLEPRSRPPGQGPDSPR
jgi:hypothetical protein